jgi:hypothetical protein
MAASAFPVSSRLDSSDHLLVNVTTSKTRTFLPVHVISCSFCLSRKCAATVSLLIGMSKLRSSFLSQSAHLFLARSDPFRTLSRRHSLNVHGIQFLQSPALALQHEEIHNGSCRQVAAGEDVSILEVDGFGNEGREERDEEVPDPVRCGRQGHALRTVATRVQLPGDCPHHGTPRCGETKDEEAGKDNQGSTCSGCRCGVILVQGERSNRGKYHEADKHPDRSGDERLATTVMLDKIEADEGDAEIDSVENHLGDVRVVDPDRSEDCGSVVEELDTCQIHSAKVRRKTNVIGTC